jgi:hypothetical protein
MAATIAAAPMGSGGVANGRTSLAFYGVFNGSPAVRRRFTSLADVDAATAVGSGVVFGA